MHMWHDIGDATVHNSEVIEYFCDVFFCVALCRRSLRTRVIRINVKLLHWSVLVRWWLIVVVAGCQHHCGYRQESSVF